MEEFRWRGTCRCKSSGGGEHVGVRVQVEGKM